MAQGIGGAVVATLAGLVTGLAVLSLVGRRVGALMRRLLGDYYEYVAIFSVIAGCVVALLAVLYFVVPLAVWLALAVFVVLLTVFVVELM